MTPGEKMTSTPYSYTFLLCGMQFFYAVGIGVFVNQQVTPRHKKPLRKLLILHGVIILLIPGF